MPLTSRADRFAAAMRLDEAPDRRPWYLGATPLATLPWLVRLRWATAIIEAFVVAVAWLFPFLDLPLDHLSLLLIFTAVTNAGMAGWLSRGRAVPRARATGGLLAYQHTQEIVKNAFNATEDNTQAVVVEVTREADRFRLTVEDQGRGLPPAVLERAGEPFYTTKEPGRGLGLGLFLAGVFAQRYGGTLTLHSGRGTTAVLELPVPSELAGAS